MGTIPEPDRPGTSSRGSNAIKPSLSLPDLKYALRRKKSLGVEEALDRFKSKGGLGADGNRRYDNDNSWMQSSGLMHESSSSSDIDLLSLSASVLPPSYFETGVDPQIGKDCTGQEPNDQQQLNVPWQNDI
ncbi:hypothetical protein EC957_007089 [Mortierella hygrophila]|uniref:Uncharacterized protein n=1 Tax=Mortierella hygrophila TaxID=979708 RepID=A0A9P6EZ12_9FUNG|nr:hypothetical protein EC957_007089 [Mortierella hygrophila]